MPVKVHIPVRVRLDHTALENRDADVNEALQAAVRRALDHSTRQVLAPRGHYYGVQLGEPQIRWSGRGLEHASPDQRQRFEEVVNQAIADAARHSKLTAYARARDGFATPFSDRAQERIDPARMSPLGYYVVPSYDGEGVPTPLPVMRDASNGPESHSVWDWPKMDPGWFHACSYDERLKILTKLLKLYGVDYQPGNGNYYGLLWRQQGGSHPMGLGVITPGGDLLGMGLPMFKSRKLVPDPKNPNIHVLQGGDVLPPGQLITAEWWTADMLRHDEELWLKEVTGPLKKPDGISADQFIAKNNEFIAHELDETMANFQNDGLMVVCGGFRLSVWMPADVKRWIGIAYIAPVANESYIFGEIDTSKGAGGGDAPNETRGDAAQGKGKAGTGQNGKGRKGGYIYSGDEGVEGQFAFPRPSNAWSVAQVCEPFSGEPAVDELSVEDAAELTRLIADIADRLAINTCKYAGHFAIDAAWTLGQRARTVSEFAAEKSTGMLEAPKHKAAPGVLDFTPSETPAVQYLRHLADVVPRLTHLANRIDAIYRRNAKLIKGLRENMHLGWMLDFGSAFNGALIESTMTHFIHSTRTVFLQLLHTSKINIDQRIDPKNFDNYASFFEQLVRSELLQENELQKLRTTLAAQTQGLFQKAMGGVLNTWRAAGWREMRNGIFDTLEGRDPFATDTSSASAGELVKGGDGKVRVKDSKGHIWTLEQLDRAIALRHDTATQIDPLMQQIMNDPKLRERFVNNVSRTRSELARVLGDMADANQNVTARVAGDEHYAFGMAPISDGDSEHPQTVPGTGFMLQGVHLLAHETMHEFFHGDGYYTLGVRKAMSIEDTRRWMKEAVGFVVPLLLAVVCAPLGALAGIAFAAEARIEAGEKMEAYHALINPESIFNYAEVEAELFAADIGLALSFIPIPGMAKTAGKVGSRAVASLLKAEVRAATGIVIRSVHRVLTKAVMKALKEGLLKAFIKQLIIGELMNRGLKLMIDPVIEEMQRQHLSYEQLLALAGEVQQE